MKRFLWLGACMAAWSGPAHSQPVAAKEGPQTQAAEAPPTDGANATKVLVIPYQAVFRSAKQRQVDKATEYLTQELGKKDSIQVLRAGTPVDGSETARFEPIQEVQQAAAEAEADHRIQDAVKLRRRVIELMEQNASALPDDQSFIMAHHHLARALMWSAQDDDAKRNIDLAARMDPNMSLPAGEFSRLYRRWYTSRRSELRREPRANLLVRSVLPGATIRIDGREADVAPVRLAQVLPGKHLISATLGDGETSRAVVTVEGGEDRETTVAFGETVGGASIGAVADALAENTLPSSAVEAARKAGEVAEVDYVVVGGLAKDDDHFNVHTYVLGVQNGKLHQVDVTQFDLALLTAESDVLRVVLGVEKAMEDFDGALASVARIESRIRPSQVVNEVDGAPDLSRRQQKKAPTRKGPRTVVRAIDDDLDIDDD